MPISLDDLRKTTSYSRRDQRRKIAPVLLGTSEDTRLAQDFCDYFAELVREGRSQADFSEQYLTQRAGGDFKLARGLVSTLTRVYVWESDTFAERLPAHDWLRLQKIGLETSSALRLAMYDYVSSVNDGFVSSDERAESLELFGAGVGLAPAVVDELLFLDAEANARLKLRTRKDGQPFRLPNGADIVRDYNRLAVETLLFNSSEIIFSFAALPGALVKRLGFLSKIYRVPYDLDLNAAGEVQLRLYGPPEAFGAPTRYGESLTELTFKTLTLAQKLAVAEAAANQVAQTVYSGPRTTLVGSEPTVTKPRRSKATVGGEVSAGSRKNAKNPYLTGVEAAVHIKGKVYALNLLEILPALALDKRRDAPVAAELEPDFTNMLAETKAVYSVNKVEAVSKAPPEPEFDSSVEAQFYQQWAALEREGQSAGWHLEREPEAIVVPAENLIFIPDFMLIRGTQRVWLEIIGFWTPAYRARKVEKLEKLKQHADYKLLLAAALELKADFQPMLFPTVFYKHFLKPTDIVALLQKEYSDLDQRVAHATSQQALLVSQLETQSYIAETALYPALQCYNKSELLGAIKQLNLSSSYVEGYGLCTPDYLERAGTALQTGLTANHSPKTRLTVEQAVSVLEQSGLPFDATRAEALLEGLPGFRIERLSLFDVFLVAC